MSFEATDMVETSKNIYFVRNFCFEKLYYSARTSACAVDARIFHILRARQILMNMVNITRAQYVEYSSVHSARGNARAVI